MNINGYNFERSIIWSGQLIDGKWYSTSINTGGLYKHVDLQELIQTYLAQYPDTDMIDGHIEKYANYFSIYPKLHKPNETSKWVIGQIELQTTRGK